MRIELFETSAVGTPAYPDAHFSFIKALNQAYIAERRIFNDNNMPEETDIEQKKAKPKEEPKVEEKPAEEKPEEKVEAPIEASKTPEVSKSEDEEEVDEDEIEEVLDEKEASAKELLSVLKEAIATLSVERGLITKPAEEDAKVKLKSMSVGELAVLSGFFK